MTESERRNDEARSLGDEEERNKFAEAGVDPSASGDDRSSATSDASADAEPGDEQGGSTPEDPIATVEQERDEYLDLAKRTKAEFENYRRRMADELAGAEARGKTDLAASLIGVIDNLERALEAVEIAPAAAISGEVEVSGSLEQGVVMTYRELCTVLERAGVEGYDPSGQRFDPTWHEALQARPAEDGSESGIVLEVMQKGYRLGDRVLRPARVIVSA